MNKVQQREIALWLSGKYKGGTGSSSKYVLARCLGATPNELSISYPNDFSDWQRCVELYNNCSFVQENINVLFDEKRHGIYPEWKILFTQGIGLNSDDISDILRPNIITLTHYLTLDNINYTIKDGILMYTLNKEEYTYSKGSYSCRTYFSEPEKEAQKDEFAKIVNSIKNQDRLNYAAIEPLIRFMEISNERCEDFYIRAFENIDKMRWFLKELSNHKDSPQWRQMFDNDNKTI